MVIKILNNGYCKVMMAYYVNYIDDINGKTLTYFDYAYERDKFINDNK